MDEECIVALVVQWIAKYGEKEYKDFFLNHIKFKKFNVYSSLFLKVINQKVINVMLKIVIKYKDELREENH